MLLTLKLKFLLLNMLINKNKQSDSRVKNTTSV